MGLEISRFLQALPTPCLNVTVVGTRIVGVAGWFRWLDVISAIELQIEACGYSAIVEDIQNSTHNS